jgi:hypothetical protein
MKTEVLNINFTLIDILKFKEINAPLFQRPYSWGIKKNNIDLENKPVEYFRDFLSNNNKNLFLGTIFIHSKTRYDYTKEDKKEFLVNLSDGQHRLAMSIISLEAVKDIIKENKTIKNYVDASLRRKDPPEEAETHIENILKNSHLKIMTENLQSEFLIDLLRKEKESIKRLLDNNELLSNKIINLDNIKKIDKIEKENNKLIKKDYQQMKKDNTLKISDIENKSPIYASYIRVKNYIKNLTADDEGVNIEYEKALIVIDFLERFSNFKIGLLILHPDQTKTSGEIDVENEAFLMFNQLNAQALPLTPSDLFYSFLSKTFKLEDLNKEKEELLSYLNFSDTSTIFTKFNYFSLEQKNIIDFIMKISSNETQHYIFVNKLYTDSEDDLLLKIKTINKHLKILFKFYDKIESSLPYNIRVLFNIFFESNNTMTLFVFILKVLNKKENIDNMTNKEYLDIFKIVVLLSAMTTYIPSSGKRPNLARDLVKKNNIDEALYYFKEHFNMETIDNIKKMFKEHLITFAFGVPKHRNIAKLLLICEIGNEIKNDLKEYKNIHYEHIFPEKYNINKTIPNLNPNIKSRYDNFYLDYGDEYIDCLGNSTILSSEINTSLSNLSPFEKVEKFKNNSINRNSSVNQQHIDFIYENYDKWDKELIESRGQNIADNIIKFLFSDISKI